ncbi:MAG: RDD family protein [Acidobacteriota bacterium]|nr:RDD family protein [Acidobacteriota bacterium]
MQQEETVEQMSFAATGAESAAGLKQMASERLEAHRRRRAGVGVSAGARAVEMGPAGRPGVSRVREAVAARYRNSVTYRDFLAQEASRALEQAQAEAEVATRKAEAQMQLLEELEQWNGAEPGPREVEIAAHQAEMRGTLAYAVADIAVAATELVAEPTDMREFGSGLTVRLYEDLNAPRVAIDALRPVLVADADERETSALDAEIAFRRAPEFEELVAEPVAISGNLIEFPRQLVATRKARPRLAEGPLREESAPQPQLRIFEVEPEQISTAPAESASAPGWQSILLEGAPRFEAVADIEAQFQYSHQPQAARLELRLMAAAVDGCCVGAALAGFAAVVAEIVGARLHNLPLPLAGASAATVACALFVMYQLLFFTFGEATPGMRYARIGLCTFSDCNPSRAAMRFRVVAILLAACPFGLGLAWAWMDEDGLGWHDRISRMYLRAY